MCNQDLLPESVNSILDDVEATLCFPILLVIIFCTIQFLVNNLTEIGMTVYQNLKDQGDSDDEDMEWKKMLKETSIPCGSFFDKIQGLFSSLSNGKPESKTPSSKKNYATSHPIQTNDYQPDWDCCDEDFD